MFRMQRDNHSGKHSIRIHLNISADIGSRANGVPRRAAHAACMIYAFKTFFEPRAQGSVLYAKRTGRAMISLARERPIRLTTDHRRGKVETELWLEGYHLWSWKRRRKVMKPKNRKTIDRDLQEVDWTERTLLWEHDSLGIWPTAHWYVLPVCGLTLRTSLLVRMGWCITRHELYRHWSDQFPPPEACRVRWYVPQRPSN